MADSQSTQVRARNKRISMNEIKGLATSVDGPGMPLNVLAVADNVSYDIEGGARKREGFGLKETYSDDTIIKHYDKINLMSNVIKVFFSKNIEPDTSFDMSEAIDKIEVSNGSDENGNTVWETKDKLDLLDPTKSLTLSLVKQYSLMEVVADTGHRCEFIIEDNDGVIYVGLQENGIKKFVNGQLEDYDNAYILGSWAFKAHDGSIFIATGTGFQSSSVMKRIIDGKIYDSFHIDASYGWMHETQSGDTYMGTRYGLKLLSKDLTVLNDATNLHGDYTGWSYETINGDFYYCDRDEKLYKFSKDMLSKIQVLVGKRITSMFEDNNSEIYVAYLGEFSDDPHGVAKFSDPDNILITGMLSYPNIIKLVDGTILLAFMQEDASGNNSQYIIQLFNNMFYIFDTVEPSINQFIQLSDGTIYIAGLQHIRKITPKLIIDNTKLKITFKTPVMIDTVDISIDKYAGTTITPSIKTTLDPVYKNDLGIDLSIYRDLLKTVPDATLVYNITQNNNNGSEIFNPDNVVETHSITIDTGNNDIIKSFQRTMLMSNLRVHAYKHISDPYETIKQNEGTVVLNKIDKVSGNIVVATVGNKIKVTIKNIDDSIYDTNEISATTSSYAKLPEYIDYVIAGQRYIVITTGKKVHVFSIFEQVDQDANGKKVIKLIESTELDDLPQLNTTDQIIAVGYNRWLEHPEQYGNDRFGFISGFNVNNIQASSLSPWTDETISYKATFDAEKESDLKDPTLTFLWTIQIYDEDKSKYVDLTASPDSEATITDSDKVECSIVYNQPGKYKVKFATSGSNTATKTIVVDIPVSKPDVIKTDTFKSEIMSCKYVDYLEGKLVFYGNGTQQIYTSLVDDPFYISAETVVKADSYNKSEEIIAIASYKDIKIIFTEGTMMSMSGVGNPFIEQPWTILPLDGTTGLVDHDATTSVMNTLAFVSKKGINIITQLTVADKRVDLYKVSDLIKDLALPYNAKDVKTSSTIMNNISLASVEDRMYASYPDRKQLLVFDFTNTSNISDGKWSRWISDGVIFDKVVSVDEQLFNIHKNTIDFKRSKVELGLSDLPLDGYYVDLSAPVKLKIATHHVTFGEEYNAKKIKRILIDTSNTYDGSSAYSVEMNADYQPNIQFDVEKFGYNRPDIKKGMSMIVGKEAMTTYRRDTNVNSKIFMISKSGRVNDLIITQTDDKPFELNAVAIDFISSVPRGRKIK